MAAKKQQRKVSRQDRDSFEAVAKRLGCDDDKATFEAKLKKIAKAKPKKTAP